MLHTTDIPLVDWDANVLRVLQHPQDLGNHKCTEWAVLCRGLNSGQFGIIWDLGTMCGNRQKQKQKCHWHLQSHQKLICQWHSQKVLWLIDECTIDRFPVIAAHELQVCSHFSGYWRRVLQSQSTGENWSVVTDRWQLSWVIAFELWWSWVVLAFELFHSSWDDYHTHW